MKLKFTPKDFQALIVSASPSENEDARKDAAMLANERLKKYLKRKSK